MTVSMPIVAGMFPSFLPERFAPVALELNGRRTFRRLLLRHARSS